MRRDDPVFLASVLKGNFDCESWKFCWYCELPALLKHVVSWPLYEGTRRCTFAFNKQYEVERTSFCFVFYLCALWVSRNSQLLRYLQLMNFYDRRVRVIHAQVSESMSCCYDKRKLIIIFLHLIHLHHLIALNDHEWNSRLQMCVCVCDVHIIMHLLLVSRKDCKLQVFIEIGDHREYKTFMSLLFCGPRKGRLS